MEKRKRLRRGDGTELYKRRSLNSTDDSSSEDDLSSKDDSFSDFQPDESLLRERHRPPDWFSSLESESSSAASSPEDMQSPNSSGGALVRSDIPSLNTPDWALLDEPTPGSLAELEASISMSRSVAQNLTSSGEHASFALLEQAHESIMELGRSYNSLMLEQTVSIGGTTPRSSVGMTSSRGGMTSSRGGTPSSPSGAGTPSSTSGAGMLSPPPGLGKTASTVFDDTPPGSRSGSEMALERTPASDPFDITESPIGRQTPSQDSFSKSSGSKTGSFPDLRGQDAESSSDTSLVAERLQQAIDEQQNNLLSARAQVMEFKVNSLKGVNAQLVQEIVALEANNDTMKQSYEQMRNNFDQQLKIVTANRAEYIEQVKQFQEAFTAQQQFFTSQLAEQKRDIQDKESKLREQLKRVWTEEVETATERNIQTELQLNKKLQAATDANTDLRLQNAQEIRKTARIQRAASERRRNIARQLEATQEQRRNIARQLKATQKLLSTAERERNKFEKEVVKANRKIDDEVEKVQQVQSELRQAQELLKKKDGKIDSYRKTVHDLLAQLDSFQKQERQGRREAAAAGAEARMKQGGFVSLSQRFNKLSLIF